MRSLVRLTLLSIVFCCLAGAQPASAQFPFLWVDEACTTVRTAGGCIRVETYKPAMPGCYPAIVLLHGSGGVEMHADQYRTVARLAAKKGYVVAIPHYQDVTGPASTREEKALKIDPDRFSAWVRTVNDVVRATADMDKVDPERIGVVGFSLGSFVGLAAATTNKRIDVVIDLFGGLPAEYEAKVKNLPPVLIVHGQSDKVVPVRHACRLAKLMSKHKRCYEIAVYPCEGHQLQGEARDDAMMRAMTFMERYLK